jgi:hypothetical protein
MEADDKCVEERARDGGEEIHRADSRRIITQ